MYYVYILRCAGGSLYTGITTDLARRFAEHAGHGGRGARYTLAHPPVSVAAAWTAPDRAAASRLERRIKALDRPGKDALLAGREPPRLELAGFSRLPDAACAAIGREI